MNRKPISRREFMRWSGLGAIALLSGGFYNRTFPKPLIPDLPNGVKLASLHSQMGEFMPDAEVLITASEQYVQILSGAQTRVYSYYGEFLNGSGVTVQSIPGSYLGPILRVRKGTNIRIIFQNDLPEDSVIHPHGLRVPEDADGQPMQAIKPGDVKHYDFQVVDRACPAWFHPHPHMRTAEQVALGLAGLFYVTDDEEALAIPGADTGANDIPLVIQDRMFDANNQFLYQPNNMWGYLGDRILVNGSIPTNKAVEPRAYRLRVLNGSNARTYKLAWSNGMPLKVIGTDGGLLPAVETRSYVTLMPGERVDLWADFTPAAGKLVTLRSLAFQPGGGMMGGGGGGMGGGGMGGGMGGGGGGMGTTLANGAAFNILSFNVSKRAKTKPVLGPLPGMEMHFDEMNVANFATPVPFTLDMAMMTWTINGRVYEMMGTAEDEMVHLNTPIAWEWINNSPIPHPMHIHNVQFQVVQRTPSASSSYTTVNQGFVDSGWKDTVLVWPGEKVKIAMMFSPHAGMYMYHCHILEHEDMGMMRNLMVMGEMPMEPMGM